MWVPKNVRNLVLFCIAIIIHQSCCCSNELFEPYRLDDTKLEWCYSKPQCAEPKWPNSCHERLHGYYASPINLDYNQNIDYDYFISEFTIPMSKYEFYQWRISYRGNTIHIIPASGGFENTPGEDTALYWSRLSWDDSHNKTYLFHSIHFHWGSRDDVGSEHTINYKSFPMEVHFTYFNEDYPVVEQAVRGGHESIFTIAVLIDVAPPNADDALVSHFLEPIIDNLYKVKKDLYTEVRGILDLKLFTNHIFYSYTGKFTAPSCRLNHWLIHRKPVFVPREHLQSIRDWDPSNFFVEKNNFRTLYKRIQNQNMYEWHAVYT